MVNPIIQKVSALYLKIPFMYGVVCCNDMYKGYDIEIVDIDSNGFYSTRIMQSVNQRLYKNYRPQDVLPSNKDQNTIEKIKNELDIILNNQGYFNTLNEKDIPIVERIRSVFKGKNVTELYNYLYNPVNEIQKEIGKQFLVLMFEKIKKQFEMFDIIEDNNYIDNEIDIAVDELMSFDQLQHTSDEIEFLDTELTRKLKNALVLLNMPSDALFVNLHSQRLENTIKGSEINVISYEPIVVAYIFIHLNESGSQINYSDLIGIKNNEFIRSGNDNTKSIIDIMIKLGFLDPKEQDNVEYYKNKIIDYLGIVIVPPVTRVRKIAQVKRKPIQKTINKKILLLPQPIKEYIKEPILWYIKDKIKDKISMSVSSQIYKDLLNYFNGDTKALKKYPKTSENYITYIQPFIKEYTDRIDNTEQLVKDKLKVHSNLVKNLKSPEKNDIKQAIKEIIKDKIKSSVLQEKENKILTLLLENFDNTEKVYSLIGNPEYYDIIKNYLKDYENALNGAIQLNNKIGEIAFRERIDHELVVKSNMDKVIKQVKNEYIQKLHDNELLYHQDLSDIRVKTFKNFKNTGTELELQNKEIKELREIYKKKIENGNTKVKKEIVKNLNVISGYKEYETQLINYQLMINKQFKTYSNEQFDYNTYIQGFIQTFIPDRFYNKLKVDVLKKLSKQEIKIKQKIINGDQNEFNILYKQIGVLQMEYMKNRVNDIKSPTSKKIINKVIPELELQFQKLKDLESIKTLNIRDLLERLNELIYERYEMIVIQELQKVFTNFHKYDKELKKFINENIPKEFHNRLNLDSIKNYTDDEMKYKMEVLKIKESFDKKEKSIKQALPKSKSIETIKENIKKEKGITKGSKNYRLYSAILLSFNTIIGYSLKDTNTIKYQLELHKESQKGTDLNKYIAKNIPKEYHNKLNVNSIKKYTKFDIAYKTEILKIKGLFTSKQKEIRKELSKSKTKSKKVDLFEHLLTIKKVQVETDIVNCIKNTKGYTKQEKEYLLTNIYKIKDLIAIKQLRLDVTENENQKKLIGDLIEYHRLYRSKIMEIAKIIRSKI